jgi:hypothetical protein
VCHAEAAALWEQVKDIEVSERLKLQAVRAGLGRELTAWTDAVKDALSRADFTPRDYDPPSYPGAANTSVEAAAVGKRSAVSS